MGESDRERIHKFTRFRILMFTCLGGSNKGARKPARRRARPVLRLTLSRSGSHLGGCQGRAQAAQDRR
ncbi:hypothetical protein TPA0910_56730 [Streptomyces hygroscopicus subsp. sporocinereus]|uniref:Uncharacterized protein n=1 Tax=Streptomyces hygroscopicus TaxID=1912 RepID=A0ABQ3U6M7_STRHY|nr:hypothetical protein TPA0910_56730 [Streptomyces hygroscopicus]